MLRPRYIALAAAVVLLTAGLAVWLVSRSATPSTPESHAAGHGHGTGTEPPAPHINASTPPGPAPPGMIWVPGGTFWMGCPDCGLADTEPLHLVRVDGFWMDAAPVTNAEFERFVRETRYVTIAEQPLDPGQFPGVP